MKIFFNFIIFNFVFCYYYLFRRRGVVHVAVGRPEAVHQREDPIVAEHREVFATVAGLESGRNRTSGLWEPQQGGPVLRPDILGSARQPVRAHRQHHRQPRRTVPVLEPLPGARVAGPGRRRSGQRHGRSVGRHNHRQVHVGAQRNFRHGQRPGCKYIKKKTPIE